MVRKTLGGMEILELHYGLVIGTSSVIETPSLQFAIGTYSLSERTRYRNVLVIGTICSDNEYTKFFCNVLGIGTAFAIRYRNVLVIGTIQWYSTDLYTYKSNDSRLLFFDGLSMESSKTCAEPL